MYSMVILSFLYITGAMSLILPTSASSKRGFGVRDGDFICNDTLSLSNSSWWYNWGTNFHDLENLTCSQKPRGEFVPMVWGVQPKYIHNISQESPFILGYNEPNEHDQSNITPEVAAAHWSEIERHAQNKFIVSPAPARCNGWHLCFKEATVWLDEFLKSCTGCRVDFLAAHTYNCDPDNDMHYLESLFKRYGKRIWLTEIACPKTLSVEKELNYMRQMIPRLEAAPYIFRYAWYIARQHDTDYHTSAVSLLQPKSPQLTRLGQLYNSSAVISVLERGTA